jgi:hypothetical protein
VNQAIATLADGLQVCIGGQKDDNAVVGFNQSRKRQSESGNQAVNKCENLLIKLATLITSS